MEIPSNPTRAAHWAAWVMISSRLDVIPWQELLVACGYAPGSDRDGRETPEPTSRFVVVGCHTESGVTTLAAFLRRMAGVPQVAVSSHSLSHG